MITSNRLKNFDGLLTRLTLRSALFPLFFFPAYDDVTLYIKAYYLAPRR